LQRTGRLIKFALKKNKKWNAYKSGNAKHVFNHEWNSRIRIEMA